MLTERAGTTPSIDTGFDWLNRRALPGELGGCARRQDAGAPKSVGHQATASG
jgi:hypothetical protein